MPRTWQLQEAKNKFSEVVARAISEGPQTITRRGTSVVVVISAADLKKLHRPKKSLVEFLSSSPVKGLKLDLERDKDTGRTVDLDLPD
jgi:prevent-host-death family protein